MHDKRIIRKKLIEDRLAINENIRGVLDMKILRAVTDTPEYKDSDIILTYVSYNGEVDTLRLIGDAFSKGKHVGCPVCVFKDNEPAMDFYYIESLDELKEGYKGIKEPDKTKAVRVSDSDISSSLVILPMVGYDPSGNRLGYGGGFYDRFLGSHDYDCTIGLAYSKQECNELPAGIYDIKPDIIVTDEIMIDLRALDKRKIDT